MSHAYEAFLVSAGLVPRKKRMQCGNHDIDDVTTCRLSVVAQIKCARSAFPVNLTSRPLSAIVSTFQTRVCGENLDKKLMDCIACGQTDSPASREHVFSSWLLKAFDREVAMELYRLHSDGRSTKEREKIKLDNFKLKRVCEGCNTGWMSLLEEAVKPIILDIVRNESRPLENLSEGELLSLARWAAKTAIIESHAVGAEFPVSGDYLKWMRANPDGAPGRFAVVACRTSVLAFGHMQHGIIRDLLAGHRVAGNVIVIALPKLAFVCAFPMLELSYECRCVKSLFTPLWPNAKAWYDMDQTPMSPMEDEVQLLLGLSERIELYHRL